MASKGRNTQTRNQHRQTIKTKNQPCAICGKPINYNLKYPNPQAFVIDHIIPLDKGGPDTLTNLQPAHATCNRTKSNKTHANGILKTSGTLQ